ncbi:MAG: hypothetical protein WKG00_16575 [Polyangiaceae bacterium]
MLAALGAGVALGLAPWPGVRFATSVGRAAARVFEHDRGSGLARIVQHRLGIAALEGSPRGWLVGSGAGAWERVSSAHAHRVGDHLPRFTGASTPNSEPLRILVEQGLVGVALMVALVVAVAAALPRGAARGRRPGWARGGGGGAAGHGGERRLRPGGVPRGGGGAGRAGHRRRRVAVARRVPGAGGR